MTVAAWGSCTYPTALNYEPEASIDNQSCLFELEGDGACPDLDGDSSVATSDLLIFSQPLG